MKYIKIESSRCLMKKDYFNNYVPYLQFDVQIKNNCKTKVVYLIYTITKKNVLITTKCTPLFFCKKLEDDFELWAWSNKIYNVDIDMCCINDYEITTTVIVDYLNFAKQDTTKALLTFEETNECSNAYSIY